MMPIGEIGVEYWWQCNWHWWTIIVINHPLW